MSAAPCEGIVVTMSEFEFRLNWRKISDAASLAALMSQTQGGFCDTVGLLSLRIRFLRRIR